MNNYQNNNNEVSGNLVDNKAIEVMIDAQIRLYDLVHSRMDKTKDNVEIKTAVIYWKMSDKMGESLGGFF